MQEDTFNFGYMSLREIMENSPSRKDGISWKREMSLRRSYCTFLKDLGIKLTVPQVYIAIATVLCHRFFLRQSLAKNDRWTIATACMFLAGKVNDNPKNPRDIITFAHEIIHKKDPDAVHRIKQKEVYAEQKKLILLAERVVLTNIGFDIDIRLPYWPLVAALKKFNLMKHENFRQVAWSFVNDGLRTLLCLQFEPHKIAAGALYLTAKFVEVTIPSDGEKLWWQDLDIPPSQLEEICTQVMNLYERRAPKSGGTEERNDGTVGKNKAAEVRSGADPASNESNFDVDQFFADVPKDQEPYSPTDQIKMIGKIKCEDYLAEKEIEPGIELAVEDKDRDENKCEDDLTEKKLVDGIELAVEDAKRDHKDNDVDIGETRDAKNASDNADSSEELKVMDDVPTVSNNRKRKKETPPAEQPAAKRRRDSSDHNDHF